MATINLSGLPENCKLTRLAITFKRVLKRVGITRFWIKEMADIRGTELKCAKIEFPSPGEAYVAVKELDGFGYNNGQFDFPLTARIDDEDSGRSRRRSPSPYRYRSREREYHDRYEEPRHSRHDGYAKERSRSPVHHHREASKLDLEIELLRKQRMIIEEERRLLLERKKLELLKEFGPSALKEFKSLEDDRERDRERDRDRERRYRPERAAEYRPRRRSPPPRANPAPAPRQRPPRERSHLPQFVLPCKLLLAELKENMEKLGTRKESFLLTKLIRATIRKRIAVALEGKPIMSGAKIVALYREKYPAHQDEDFIKKHLKDLRACHLPSKGDDVTETAEKPEAEKADEQENKEVDENVQTDTNADVGSVKTEPEEVSNEVSVKEEPNSSTDAQGIDKELEQTENGDQVEKAECNQSVGSSEALNLHDKNDEDWVEGEHDWDDPTQQPAEIKE